MTGSTPSRVAQGAGAIALLLAAARSLWPYLGTLGHDPMALDSVYWLVRSNVANEGWQAWTFGGPHFIAYRPVAALSFSLTSVFAGLDPLAYRIFDLALHAANGALVFAVARRLAPGTHFLIGGVAALIFLGHPAGEEVVPWLARRHNALACGFSLLAIHSLLRALDRPRSRRTGLAAAAWLTAALLSNEVAFTTAAALPFLAWAARPAAGWSGSLRAAAPALVAAAAVLALRLALVGGVGGYDPEGAGPARIARVSLAFWRDLVSFDVIFPLSVAALFLAPLGAVLVARAELRSALHGRLLLVLVGWLVGASLLLALQQVWFPRELYALLPAYALAIAFGMDALHRTRPVAARSFSTLIVGGYLGLLLSAGWWLQADRIAEWHAMQDQLDELRAGLDTLPDRSEVLLALAYPAVEWRSNPLRARPPRPGPPRSIRIPAVWLSEEYAGRGIGVRDAVAFPRSASQPARFETLDGRAALLFDPSRPFSVAREIERGEHDGRVALWLDTVPGAPEGERWLFLRDAGLGAFFPLGATRAAAPAGDEPALDVLLIVVDTLRRDHLGAYGYSRDTSPHIDRLAEEGVRYQRALAAAPWTTPSVASLLTSRQPSALGIRDLDSKLQDDAVLLSERLRERGWKTGAVVSHRFVSERWGFDQGYDFFDDDNALDHEAVTSPAISERAIAFLESAGDAPFFLLLHYFDPHFAYLEHPGFEFPREQPYDGPAGPDVRFGELLQQQQRLAAADAEELMRRYDSEIRFTDHHIGRVLDHLRASGRLERTLVVLTADHGEEFLDHGRLGHTKTLYEEVVGVPLIVRRPGGRPGVVERPVALVDVVPTILEALGLPIPPELAGVPLGAAEGDRVLFTATDRKQPKRAAVSGRRKRIHDLEAGSHEEYDLLSDPQERAPLAAPDPGLARALEAFERSLSAERQTGPGLQLSDEEKERLRLLGYGDDD